MAPQHTQAIECSVFNFHLGKETYAVFIIILLCIAFITHRNMHRPPKRNFDTMSNEPTPGYKDMDSSQQASSSDEITRSSPPPTSDYLDPICDVSHMGSTLPTSGFLAAKADIEHEAAAAALLANRENATASSTAPSTTATASVNPKDQQREEREGGSSSSPPPPPKRRRHSYTSSVAHRHQDETQIRSQDQDEDEDRDRDRDPARDPPGRKTGRENSLRAASRHDETRYFREASSIRSYEDEEEEDSGGAAEDGQRDGDDNHRDQDAENVLDARLIWRRRTMVFEGNGKLES